MRIDKELFTDEELDILERINVKLITDEFCTEFIEPKAIELQDDESITIVVRAR